METFKRSTTASAELSPQYESETKGNKPREAPAVSFADSVTRLGDICSISTWSTYVHGQQSVPSRNGITCSRPFHLTPWQPWQPTPSCISTDNPIFRLLRRDDILAVRTFRVQSNSLYGCDCNRFLSPVNGNTHPQHSPIHMHILWTRSIVDDLVPAVPSIKVILLAVPQLPHSIGFYKKYNYSEQNVTILGN